MAKCLSWNTIRCVQMHDGGFTLWSRQTQIISVSEKAFDIKPRPKQETTSNGVWVWYGLTILDITVTVKDVPVLSTSHLDWWRTSSCLKETSGVRLSFWFYTHSICLLFCCASRTYRIFFFSGLRQKPTAFSFRGLKSSVVPFNVPESFTMQNYRNDTNKW